jgi:hypothetical protein
MSEEDSQTKEKPKVKIVITCSKEDQQKSAGWKTLEKIKAKEPERLFKKYCLPKMQSWQDWDREIVKEVALKILSSEFSKFIAENGLKWNPRHKKVYEADVGQLIIDLVEYAHFNRLVNLPHCPRDIKRADIVKTFDEHWCWVSEMVLQAPGVRKDSIQNQGKEWRKKIQETADKFPLYWREAIQEKVWPGHRFVPENQKQKSHVFTAHVFADVFLGHAPKIPTGTMVKWVNIVLKSLGRPTVSESKLNDYISSRKREPILPGTPISITE